MPEIAGAKTETQLRPGRCLRSAEGAEDETDQAVRLVRQHRVDALMTLRKIWTCPGDIRDRPSVAFCDA